jgi:putative ABC transport system permease protein
MLTAEVALSLVLLAGAGLLLKSFARLYRLDPGYETRRIDRFTLNLPAATYPDLASIVSIYETLEQRIAAEPGVEAVGSAFGPVLGRSSISGDVRVEGKPEPAPGEATTARLSPMTSGYLEVMRIPVLRGRALLPSDDGASVPVALVNETFVRQNLAGVDPLGQRVSVSANFGYGNPTWTIVGVIPDIKSRSLREDPPAEVYIPHAHFGPGTLTVSVRTAVGAPPVLPAVRETVRALDPDLPLLSVETVAEAVARQVAPMRFFLSLVGLFAVLALVLAATGLYGVATFLASQRRREVGIRLAMGAPRRSVVAQMLGQGLRPALWGVVLGLAGAWAAGRSLESLLFQVEATDPGVFGGVAVLLLAVVLFAVLIPARAASRVDPVEALRAE